MKKLLLFTVLIAVSFSNAQNQYNYGFSGVTADLTTAGWIRTNQSTLPSATTLWTIANYVSHTVTGSAPANAFGDQTYANGQTSPVPNGQAGGGNSFALVNFTSTTSTAATGATISNWLISPEITVDNGDIVTFYTRKGVASTVTTGDFPDRLELRMSSDATTVVPSTGPTDVGSFTTLGVSVNPALAAGFVYPKVWTQYSYTVSGLSGPTAVKFGFRYFVTNGGTNGANSDIIGIDTFSVDRTLGTADFFKSNFSVYPNPANDVINITSLNNTEITSMSILDINGRVVKQINSSLLTISINDLNSGVYFLKINTIEGTGTTRVVKN